MTWGLFATVNTLAWNIVSGVNTLASGNLWSILIFFVAIALLFGVVAFLKRK